MDAHLQIIDKNEKLYKRMIKILSIKLKITTERFRCSPFLTLIFIMKYLTCHRFFGGLKNTWMIQFKRKKIVNLDANFSSFKFQSSFYTLFIIYWIIHFECLSFVDGNISDDFCFSLTTFSMITVDTL